VAKAFRDLIVWQKAMDLTVEVYRLTERFPKSEVYGLTSQLRRCSVSIASNIAEGSGRGTRKDFASFAGIARGSNYELETQLLLAQRLGYVAEVDSEAARSLSTDVGKMLRDLSLT
jgi:four helix bundle protein